MGTLTSLSDFPKEKSSVVTIGFFDGIHLGHQELLRQTRKTGKQLNAESVVLTFTNHPSELFSPGNPPKLLLERGEAYRRMEEMGIDWIITLPFDEKFSNQSTEAFIDSLLTELHMKALVLGHDSRIGKERKGTPEIVQELAGQKQFEVSYIPPFSIDHTPISSSRIREAIIHGDLTTAEKLLGRPYSVKLPVIPGRGIGKSEMGFPTANMDVTTTVVPPEGVYSVLLKSEGVVYEGVANLGRAPTVRGDKKLLLEVHVIDQELDLTGHEVEVTFVNFIREELKFDSLSALREQIARDVKMAKEQLHSLS